MVFIPPHTGGPNNAPSGAFSKDFIFVPHEEELSAEDMARFVQEMIGVQVPLIGGGYKFVQRKKKKVDRYLITIYIIFFFFNPLSKILIK